MSAKAQTPVPARVEAIPYAELVNIRDRYPDPPGREEAGLYCLIHPLRLRSDAAEAYRQVAALLRDPRTSLEEVESLLEQINPGLASLAPEDMEPEELLPLIFKPGGGSSTGILGAVTWPDLHTALWVLSFFAEPNQVAWAVDWETHVEGWLIAGPGEVVQGTNAVAFF